MSPGETAMVRPSVAKALESSRRATIMQRPDSPAADRETKPAGPTETKDTDAQRLGRKALADGDYNDARSALAKMGLNGSGSKPEVMSRLQEALS